MNLEQQLTAFKQHLELAERSANTIAACVGDVRLFARWFEQSTGYPRAIAFQKSGADVE